MVEQQEPTAYVNPYKFNAKELDSETDLYYYGARYYNPRISIWYGVDPLAVYNPVMEDQFYGDGQHNGGVYNSGNLNPYIYCYQNPIVYVDPNGKQNYSTVISGKFSALGRAIDDGIRNALNSVYNASKNFAIGAYNTFDSIVHRDPMYSAAEDDIPLGDPNDPLGIGAAHNTIRSGTSAEKWQLAGSLAFSAALARSLKGGSVKNVELMGGANSSLKNYVNYDINAKVGIADDVANFGNYFKPGSLKNIVVNNPQAAFLEEISGSLSKGGQVTIRGTMSNSNFNKIWNGKAAGLNGYKILNRAENVPNNGYLRTDGKPINGQINQITLQKK